jgi:hypothetical protein
MIPQFPDSDVRALVVEELVFEEREEKHRTWLVKALSKDGRRVTDVPPTHALQALSSGSVAGARFVTGILTPKRLEVVIADAAQAWFNLRASLSRNAFVNAARYRLACLNRLKETEGNQKLLGAGRHPGTDLDYRILVLRAKLEEALTQSPDQTEGTRRRNRLLSVAVEGVGLDE